MRLYTRYLFVKHDAAGALLAMPAHHALSRIGELGDGWALIEAEFDGVQFDAYAGDTDNYLMLPSLQAPADRLKDTHTAIFTAHGVTVTAGDTAVNLLRKLRDVKGFVRKIDAAS